MKGSIWNIIPGLVLILVAIHNKPAAGCSCAPAHPQSHFCTADFVVIVRPIRRSNRLVAGNVAYKVEVKKSYKMNSRAHKMLKHGRILTPAFDSLCGVYMELGRLYIIAGRVPQINLCNYVKEYMKMSVIERRGFSGAYQKGCKCQVQSCFRNRCPEVNSVTTCSWSPFAKCETDFSACLMTPWSTPEGVIATCQWRRTPAYKKCMADP